MHTVAANTFRMLIGQAQRAGADMPAILKRCGLSVDVGALAETSRLPLSTAATVVEAVECELGTDLWLLRSLEPGDFGLLEYLFRQSPTLGAAFNAMRDYHRLAAADDIVVEVEGSTISVRFLDPQRTSSFNRVACQAWSYVLVGCGRRMTATPWSPLEIDLPITAPPDDSPYVELFGIRPNYDSEKLRVRVSDDAMGLGIRDYDPSLAQVLRTMGNDLMSRIGGSAELPDLLRCAIVETLPRGTTCLEEVAQRIGLSKRSLQRRLKEDGLTFSTVVDDVRRDLAARYLRELEVTVEEVAYLLGYSSPRGFFTAFQRWVGKSPTEYRREHATDVVR